MQYNTYYISIQIKYFIQSKTTMGDASLNLFLLLFNRGNPCPACPMESIFLFIPSGWNSRLVGAIPLGCGSVLRFCTTCLIVRRLHRLRHIKSHKLIFCVQVIYFQN